MAINRNTEEALDRAFTKDRRARAGATVAVFVVFFTAVAVLGALAAIANLVA